MGDENFTVADFAGIGALDNGLGDKGGLSVIDDDVDLDLWQEIDGVFRTTVNFRVAFCRPKPLTSVTVMPCTPTSARASLTSSSLNGLIIASIFFMMVQVVFC